MVGVSRDLPMNEITLYPGTKGDYGGEVAPIPPEAFDTPEKKRSSIITLLAGEVAEHGTDRIDAFSRPSQPDLIAARKLAEQISADPDGLLDELLVEATACVEREVEKIDLIARDLDERIAAHPDRGAAQSRIGLHKLLGNRPVRDVNGTITHFEPVPPGEEGEPGSEAGVI